MPRFHALLVGIDDYPEPVRKLSGCVNDVRAMRGYLEGRVPAGDLALQVLTDREATRRRIINTFRSHLGNAKEGETALFYYAGHGSQEQTPPLYAHSEPDGLDETLMAWDSRLQGGWDIADKELGVLIAEVAQRGAHVVVILDSCHSGTATRLDIWPRSGPTDVRVRPAETFWFFAEGAGVAPELNPDGGWRTLPQGKHVLLAACRPFEVARESNRGNVRRGAFSYHLVETLKALGGAVSYRDLHKRVQILVSNDFSGGQVPQGDGDLEGILFNGAVPERPPLFYVRNVEDAGWKLDAGAVHAIQPGSELAVFRSGTTDFRRLDQKIATVTVTEVGAAESVVQSTNGRLPEGESALPAVLTKAPLSRLRVALETEVQGLRDAVQASPYLELASADDARVAVVEAPDGFHFRRPGESADLTFPLVGVKVDKVIEALVKITRWETLVELDNPESLITRDLQMTVHVWEGPPATPDGPPRVSTPPAGEELLLSSEVNSLGQMIPARFTVEITNRGTTALYFALLGLSENFGVQLIQDPASMGLLAAGRTVWIRKADGIPLNVPDHYHQQGVTRRRDLLVLFVSEAETDFSLLCQDGVGTALKSLSLPREGESLGMLESLFYRMGIREIDDDRLRPSMAHEWAVQKQALIAERLNLFNNPNLRSAEIELCAGVWLHHAQFNPLARLVSTASAAELDTLGAPPQLFGAFTTRALALAGKFASDGGLSVLELRGGDQRRITPENPLEIRADRPDIQPGEVALILAFNGEDWWLVGRCAAARTAREPQRFEIPQLPTAADRLWLLFQAAREEDVAGIWTGSMRKLSGAA